MNKVINYRLRQERESRGWSQARVAEQIGTDAVNISRWERGHAMPSPYFREKLCQLFEKSAQELGFLPDPRSESEPIPVLISDMPSPTFPARPENSYYQLFEPQVQILDQFSRLLASFSYVLGCLSGLFIFLLINKGNRFVRFHSLQSTLFFASSHILSLLLLIAMRVLPKHSTDIFQTLLEVGIPLLLMVLNLFTCVVWFVGIIQAWRGKYYELPFIGQLSIKITASGQAQPGARVKEERVQ
ncbi:helix-turn-helix domain-containing protein [Ktedonosporobacter rubrisoli]|uniref:Helix-turn-helix domain-containing protein n=1 Tax=Ktedonosporobacter rubrisoli TaxID=2509675 RepID=A0A4P6JIX0_KTERU|nr:helix-turn-helix domain-containing protein [Ktedonosporobacter rubrisoli]QBD74860.1 helix-turn-helix domain-containing protein [Ktedonosporobacter rubrisoli]